MGSSIDMDNTATQTKMANRWLPAAAILTIMDPIMNPNQPEPLMKLLTFIRQDSLQYNTSMLINSTTTLNFASPDFLTRNNLRGKCTRVPTIFVQITNEQRISTSKILPPTNVSLAQ